MSAQGTPDPTQLVDAQDAAVVDERAPVDPADVAVVTARFDDFFVEKNGLIYDTAGTLQVGEDGEPLTRWEAIEKKTRELHPKYQSPEPFEQFSAPRTLMMTIGAFEG